MNFLKGRIFHPSFRRILIPNEAKCRCESQFTTSRQCTKRRLRIIGEVQGIKGNEDAYKIGQLFMHKVFTYRGVILYSWKLKYYDHDVSERTGTRRSWEERLYYQVFMDERDSSNRDMMCMTTTPTFLGKEESSIYTLPVSDYVSHEDIVPYANLLEKSLPIKHALFADCFSPDRKNRETFAKWLTRNNRWLPLSEVHKLTTNDVQVTLMTVYMGMMENIYYWQYNIRIENLSNEPVMLRERQWKIFKKQSGVMAIEKDRGVNGMEPELSKKKPAFQYGSHVSLNEPRAYMYGTYKLERQDGSTFEVKIPAADLEASTETVKFSAEPNLDPFAG